MKAFDDDTITITVSDTLAIESLPGHGIHGCYKGETPWQSQWLRLVTSCHIRQEEVTAD